MTESSNSLTDAATEEGNAAELFDAVGGLAGRLDLKSLERVYILQTLAAVNGSRKAAVACLGISERTLRHKLRQYRLETSN